jgi:hypothetical protein
LSRFSPEFVVIATICFVSFSFESPRISRLMAQIAAGGADGGQTWGWIRAWMAVDGGESHLTEHDRSAYLPADHLRTISMTY